VPRGQRDFRTIKGPVVRQSFPIGEEPDTTEITPTLISLEPDSEVSHCLINLNMSSDSR
jgi:hypothetical protein